MTLITILALILAATTTALAVRIFLNDRRRSAARIAALATDIHAAGPDTQSAQGERRPPVGRALQGRPGEWRSTRDQSPQVEEQVDQVPDAAGREMFSSDGRDRRRLLQRPIVLAFGGAAALLTVSTFSWYRSPSKEPIASQNQKSVAAPAPLPLELVALDHERTNDHLTVRGIVRNPDHAPEVDHLMAVVLLFNQQGGFVTSGRAAVDAAKLQPGAETAFMITVASSDVGRYRVSFRTDDRIVPHVDRRRSGGGENADGRS